MTVSEICEWRDSFLSLRARRPASTDRRVWRPWHAVRPPLAPGTLAALALFCYIVLFSDPSRKGGSGVPAAAREGPRPLRDDALVDARGRFASAEARRTAAVCNQTQVCPYEGSCPTLLAI